MSSSHQAYRPGSSILALGLKGPRANVELSGQYAWQRDTRHVITAMYMSTEVSEFSTHVPFSENLGTCGLFLNSEMDNCLCFGNTFSVMYSRTSMARTPMGS